MEHRAAIGPGGAEGNQACLVEIHLHRLGDEHLDRPPRGCVVVEPGEAVDGQALHDTAPFHAPRAAPDVGKPARPPKLPDDDAGQRPDGTVPEPPGAVGPVCLLAIAETPLCPRSLVGRHTIRPANPAIVGQSAQNPRQGQPDKPRFLAVAQRSPLHEIRGRLVGVGDGQCIEPLERVEPQEFRRRIDEQRREGRRGDLGQTRQQADVVGVVAELVVSHEEPVGGSARGAKLLLVDFSPHGRAIELDGIRTIACQFPLRHREEPYFNPRPAVRGVVGIDRLADHPGEAPP